MKQRLSPSAFTLLELIIVMIILAIAAAMAVPALRTFSIGRRTDNAVTTVLTLANHARVQAISEGRTYRLNFDTKQNAMWLTVQNGGVYAAPSGDFGEHFAMPEGVVLDVNVVAMPNMQQLLPADAQVTAVTIAPPFGQPLATGNAVMQVARTDGTYMEFQPSGRVDPVHVKLTDKLGKVVDLGCQSSTETLHVLTAAEMQ